MGGRGRGLLLATSSVGRPGAPQQRRTSPSGIRASASSGPPETNADTWRRQPRASGRRWPPAVGRAQGCGTEAPAHLSETPTTSYHGFLDRTPVSKHKAMNACSRDRSASLSSAAASSTVRDCDGRPACPCGVSTSAETFRRARSWALGVANNLGKAVVRLLKRPGGMRGRHLRQRTPHILYGQVLQRDRPDHSQQWLQRVAVDLDRLGDTAGKAVSQPVVDGLRDRVPGDGSDASVELRVQLLKLVPDLSLGRPADLLTERFPSASKPSETTPRQRPAQVL